MNEILSICRALSDRNRLRVVAALVSHKELCACQLTEMLAVSGATASRHMRVLLDCGLVESRKAGRWVFYRLREQGSGGGEFAQVLTWLRVEFGRSAEVVLDQERLQEITRCSPEDFCRRHRGQNWMRSTKVGGRMNNG